MKTVILAACAVVAIQIGTTWWLVRYIDARITVIAHNARAVKLGVHGSKSASASPHDGLDQLSDEELLAAAKAAGVSNHDVGFDLSTAKPHVWWLRSQQRHSSDSR